MAGAAAVVAVSAALAWSLAGQQNSPALTLVRTVADGSAVIAFGLAAVPMLDIDRYRGELIRRATGPLTIAGAVWLVAELLRLGAAAAQAAAVPVERLSVHTTVDFALHTAAGRSGLFSAVAAGLVWAASVAAPRSATTNVAVAGLAAAGLAARPLTGHLAESGIGGVAVAVHTLAAALWCGALAALVLDGRAPRPVVQGAAAVLAVVAAVCGGVVGRGRGGSGSDDWFAESAVRDGIRPAAFRKGRGDGSSDCAGIPQQDNVAARRKVAPHNGGGVAVAGAVRTGHHGRRADPGSCAGSDRLAPYPAWHDGSHCRGEHTGAKEQPDGRPTGSTRRKA